MSTGFSLPVMDFQPKLRLLKGTGFSPYIIPCSRNRALAPEGMRHNLSHFLRRVRPAAPLAQIKQPLLGSIDIFEFLEVFLDRLRYQ